MKRILFLSTICVSLVYAIELQPAKTLKSISQKATEKVINDFKKNTLTKSAYDETKDYISNRLVRCSQGRAI